MRTLAEVMLSNAVIAVVLALLASVIGRYCRRPPVLYALWLLVLLKLVTPPLFRVPVTFLPTEARVASNSPAVTGQVAHPLMPLCAESMESIESDCEPSLTSTLSRSQEFETTNKQQVGIVTRSPTGATSQIERSVEALSAERSIPPMRHHANGFENVPSSAPGAGRHSVDWRQFVLFVWILGSLTWLSVVALRLLRFSREVGRPWPVDHPLQHRADQLARHMGLRRAPMIKLVNAVIPPMLWAMRRPAIILLPKPLFLRLSFEQQTTLLAHELAHYRRRDHWVRWFEVFVVALYWWHPVVWIARRELQRAEEQCCDAWVLWALPNEGCAYAGAILETIDFLAADRRLAPMLASGLGPVQLLERRFEMILHARPMRRLSTRAQGALVLLALFVLPLSAKGQAPGGPAKPAAVGVGAPSAVRSAAVEPATSVDVPGEAANHALRPVTSATAEAALSPTENDTERRLQRLENMMEKILAELTDRRIGTTSKPSSRAPANGLQNYPRTPMVGAPVLTAVTSAPTLSGLKKQRIDIEEQLEILQQRLNEIDEQIAKFQSDRPGKQYDREKR